MRESEEWLEEGKKKSIQYGRWLHLEESLYIDGNHLRDFSVG